ncbi:MAG: hypothetical protein AB7K24_18075 [Gemmataceae bacterium]
MSLHATPPAKAAELEKLRRLGVARPGPPLTEVLCPWCDQQRLRPRYRTEGRYGALCFDCGDVEIPATQLETLVPDFNRFFEVLREGIPGASGDSFAVLVQDLLWHLASFHHRSRRIELHFAWLPDAESERRVAKAITDATGDQHKLVICSARTVLSNLTKPGQRVVSALADAISVVDGRLQIHGSALDLVVGFPPQADEPEIDIAPDGSWLKVNGRELRLSGKQRDFALVMVEAWRADNRRPKLEWVLRRAGYGDGTSELRHVTKRAEFLEFFGYGNGEVWINRS